MSLRKLSYLEPRPRSGAVDKEMGIASMETAVAMKMMQVNEMALMEHENGQVRSPGKINM